MHVFRIVMSTGADDGLTEAWMDGQTAPRVCLMCVTSLRMHQCAQLLLRRSLKFTSYFHAHTHPTPDWACIAARTSHMNPRSIWMNCGEGPTRESVALPPGKEAVTRVGEGDGGDTSDGNRSK